MCHNALALSSLQASNWSVGGGCRSLSTSNLCVCAFCLFLFLGFATSTRAISLLSNFCNGYMTICLLMEK